MFLPSLKQGWCNWIVYECKRIFDLLELKWGVFWELGFNFHKMRNSYPVSYTQTQTKPGNLPGTNRKSWVGSGNILTNPEPIRDLPGFRVGLKFPSGIQEGLNFFFSFTCDPSRNPTRDLTRVLPRSLPGIYLGSTRVPTRDLPGSLLGIFAGPYPRSTRDRTQTYPWPYPRPTWDLPVTLSGTLPWISSGTLPGI